MTAVVRKVLLGLALAAAVPVVAMALGTVVPRAIAIPEAEAGPMFRAEAPRRRILVLANAIHTSIAVPADPDVLEAFAFVSGEGLPLDYPGVSWIVFGWGGRSFYMETPTWADLKPGPVIDALTWDRSVMHVRRSGEIPASLSNVRAVDLAPPEFGRLLSGIRSSFQPGNAGIPRRIVGAAYGDHDLFFPANGGFNALAGCNTWTAHMLRIAGQTTGAWTPLPFSLVWSLDLHAAP